MGGDEEKPSLRPPLHGYYRREAEAPRTSFALVDLKAYIADRDNYTSASCKLSDGTHIRVTFCAAPPPLVSYLCVWCPGLPPTEIDLEPTVLAVESDLLLLDFSLHGWRHVDYLVYKAYDGSGPSLQLLHLPDPCLDKNCSFSLLPHRDIAQRHQPVDGGEDDSSGFRLRRHGEDCHYYVAVFYYDSNNESEYSFKLWVFDSEEEQDSHYLPLPAGLITNRVMVQPALLFRDIALVQGRLTVVDLHPPTGPDANQNFNWGVSTWSRKVTDLWEEDWRHDYNVCSPDISVDQDTENVSLLPVLKDSQGQLRPTLGRLYIAHPMLSLSDSHAVYIMAKASICDKKKALVLSIDLAEPRLQGVAEFAAERMLGAIFSYTCTQSWIPKYFNPGGGLKRSGDFHAAYLRKLKSKIDEVRSEYLESIDEEHRVYLELPIDAEDDHISGGSKGAEHDNDIMDVDL
ncbi:hypothetical protein HU200_014013 [Digitaria exilis]|uniref:DUF1618 domain-containing protein n=1 Tax=Digitaria exilis TaxID=1010633 RepID=A0A835FCG0_9POAL|nr:hypothetical protein HU200_014013 [Digitaria exilis]